MTEPALAKAPTARVSKVRRLAAKLLLLLVTLSICVTLLEIAVRRLFPFFNPKAQVPFQMTTNGVALGPPLQTVRQATPKGDYDSLIRFSADGFRDSKTLADSTEEDWFALGDSYTLGWGVPEEERFSNRLEQDFRKGGSPLRVFNIAIPDNIIGYQRLLSYAEKRGAKVRHLIVGICMENDLLDYSAGKSAWDLMPQPVAPASRKEAARKWLKSHSALYIASSFVLQKIPILRGALEKAGIARDIDQLTGQNEWSEVVLKTSRDELVKLVLGRDALIVIIPARHLWRGNNRETENRIHQAFVGMLREAGLNVLDLKSSIEQEGDPLSCYFKADPHWNARGHAVAARELFKAIQARAQR